jgi:Zn-finger nucleic acid-binding protein
MVAMADACPRCKQALTLGDLRQIPVAACHACKGTLIAQLDLPRLLEALSAPLLRSFDLDAKLEAVPDPSPRLDCPNCARRMERDDYCAAHLVFFDRCNRCNLLWFDSDDLGAMALMWARMNARQAHAQAIALEATSNLLLESHRLVDRGLLGTLIWDAYYFR